MYEAVYTSGFRRDFRLCMKQGKNMNALRVTMEALENGAKLPREYNDHPLNGEYSGTRECHLEGPHSDWLLIYEKRGTKNHCIYQNRKPC